MSGSWSRSGRGQLGLPTAVILIAAVYGAGAGAVLFAPDGDPVATWWPAAGIAVALVSLAPRRFWWALAGGIAVVSALANVTGGRPLDLSACFGVANAAEAVVAACSCAGAATGSPLSTPSTTSCGWPAPPCSVP